jgi:hypothetical protein
VAKRRGWARLKRWPNSAVGSLPAGHNGLRRSSFGGRKPDSDAGQKSDAPCHRHHRDSGPPFIGSDGFAESTFDRRRCLIVHR